jgi:hypothetical protein
MIEVPSLLAHAILEFHRGPLCVGHGHHIARLRFELVFGMVSGDHHDGRSMLVHFGVVPVSERDGDPRLGGSTESGNLNRPHYQSAFGRF